MTFFIDSKGQVRDVLSSVLNFDEHVKFVKKWLTTLEAEDKKDQAPSATSDPAPAAAPSEPEPAAAAA